MLIDFIYIGLLIYICYLAVLLVRSEESLKDNQEIIKIELAELQISFAKHLQEHSERNVKFNRIMEKINNNQL